MMSPRPFLYYSAFLLVITSRVSAGGWTLRDMYKTLDTRACFSIFHSGGTVGCSADAQTDDSEGPLLLVDSSTALASFLAAPSPSTVALPATLFTAQNVASLQATGEVTGLLVLDVFASPGSTSGDTNVFVPTTNGHSPAPQSPQGTGTPESVLAPNGGSVPWNAAGVPSGSGLPPPLLMAEIRFPVYAVSADDSAWVRARVANAGDVVLTAEMHGYFGPKGMTSLRCLKTYEGNNGPMCGPIGGQSVWASVGPIDPDKPTVMVVARLDAQGFFKGGGGDVATQVTYIDVPGEARLTFLPNPTGPTPQLVPGGDATLSALVATIAAVEAVAKMPAATRSANIVVAAFDADTYGFVGSRRFARDITSFVCKEAIASAQCADEKGARNGCQGSSPCANPVKRSTDFLQLKKSLAMPGSIVLAADQVGQEVAGGSTLFVHGTDAATRSKLTALSLGADAGSFAAASGAPGALPTTPLTGLRQEMPTLSGVVLSAYDAAYASKAYGSFADTLKTSNVDPGAVTNAATKLARAVDLLSSGNTAGSTVSADATFVASLFSDLVASGGALSNSSATLNAGLYPSTYGPTKLFMCSDSDPCTDDDSSFVGFENQEENLIPTTAAKQVRFEGSYSFMQDWAFRRLANVTAYEDSGASLGECKTSCASTVVNDMLASKCSVGGKCFVRTARLHDAVSPALRPRPPASAFPDGKQGLGSGTIRNALVYEVLNASAPLWTEPLWGTARMSFPDDTYMAVRIFVKSDAKTDWIIAIVGLLFVTGMLFIARAVLPRKLKTLKLL